MTNAEHHNALQDALARIAQLSEERGALAALTLRQAEEIEAAHKTLVSARRHMLVTDAARVAQWEWDVPSGRIFLSTRWDEMIGDAAPDSLWDLRELLSRVHPEDVQAVRAAFEAALSGSNDRYAVEHRVAAAAGWIWIESIGMITERDAAGDPLKLTGYNRDITARREMLAEIDKARAEFPGVTVLVHPECSMEVVDAADAAGSTDFIGTAIAAASKVTTFAIGTEINMVNRLAAQYPQHTIFSLDPVLCPCSTMYRIHPGYLAWVLEALVHGEVLNQIRVPELVAAPARIALERMLAAQPGARTALADVIGD